MKRHLVLILLLSAVFFITGAQDDGLLTNPGFEEPFTNRGGNPERLVAEGWEPWNVPPEDGSSSSENQQPEYEPAAPDDSRIRSGDNAQLFFTFFATHTGGVYQRVTGITPGTELRFSVYAYIWSSTFEDVERSESPGDVIVYVGIDPTGGTDGTSDDIVWSPPAPDQYDDYRQYSVTATAATNAVTVFVRSIVDFPVQNNYVYLDDAMLEVVSQGEEPTATPEPATDTPQPTNTPEQPTPTSTMTPGDDPTPTQENGGIVTPDPSATTFVPPFIPTNTPTIQPTNTQPAATNTPSVGVGGPENPTPVFRNSILHTVQRGDTVARLAVLYGSTSQAIIEANGLGEDALIFVGQGLTIPVRNPVPATSTPTATPRVVIVTATPSVGTGGTGGPTVGTYTVRRGDTLSRIARLFNTTVDAIAQANGITNPNRIDVGQVLIIPGTGGPTIVPTSPPAAIVMPEPPPAEQPLVYVVQPGENLYRIALRFNTTMRAIQQANNISNVNLIFAGQTLVIPQ